MYLPRDASLALWYPHHDEEPRVKFNGFTPTGVTTAFKYYSAKNTEIASSAMSGLGREDAYE